MNGSEICDPQRRGIVAMTTVTDTRVSQPGAVALTARNGVWRVVHTQAEAKHAKDRQFFDTDDPNWDYTCPSP